jgi:hypothetical protein
MPSKRRLIHKGIVFTVEAADVPGLYRFRFQIGDQMVEGKTKTNLKGMAIQRAKVTVDRWLRKRREDSSASRPRDAVANSRSAPLGVDRLR